jgi:hypothetical protein
MLAPRYCSLWWRDVQPDGCRCPGPIQGVP